MPTHDGRPDALPHRAHVADRVPRDLEGPAVDDLGVAIEVPLEKRANVVLRVRDEAIDGDHRVHENSAHDSIMPGQSAPWAHASAGGAWRNLCRHHTDDSGHNEAASPGAWFLRSILEAVLARGAFAISTAVLTPTVTHSLHVVSADRLRPQPATVPPTGLIGQVSDTALVTASPLASPAICQCTLIGAFQTCG